MTAAATRARADMWDKKTYVTISQSIEVPGAILPPGKYVFKLLNSASDRHIVQILNDRENHVFATNLAIPIERMEPADKTVISFYEMPGGGPEPIHAWYYPGDTIGQEFLYPKQRAHEIAQAIHGHVPEVAQAQQLVTPAQTETSQTSPTAAAPVTPAPAEPPAPPESTAATEPPPPAPSVSEQPAPSEPPAQATPPQEQATPSAPTEPSMPKTASNDLGIGLVGLGCLSLAGCLKLASRQLRSGR
jgi:hypothetical protein